MTLYYSLVFALLVFEMAVFCLLIFPLPFTWRKNLFHFISTSPIVAKIQYGLKITFIFILLLFIDSCNRVWRVTDDSQQTAESSVRESYRSDMQARKFYAQRNMYLCGFTLFLSLVLARTYTMISEILAYEEQVAKLKGSSDEGVKTGAKNGSEIERLQKELARKDRDLETLKRQAAGNNKAYDDLADQHVKATARAGDVKKDL